MNARRAATRDSDRRPWFWGFVGRTVLATLVVWLTLAALSALTLLIFGGAVLGLLAGGGSEPVPDDVVELPPFEITQDTEDAGQLPIPPEWEEEPQTTTQPAELPVALSATSDVPAEVSWQVGNESATETFTGEWSMEATTEPNGFDTVSVDVVPVDYVPGTTTCTITVDGQEMDAGTATNESGGTYCIA